MFHSDGKLQPAREVLLWTRIQIKKRTLSCLIRKVFYSCPPAVHRSSRDSVDDVLFRLLVQNYRFVCRCSEGFIIPVDPMIRGFVAVLLHIHTIVKVLYLVRFVVVQPG